MYNNTHHPIDAGEIQGSYQIKVTTTALALLLSTSHPELEKINVQGQLIEVIGVSSSSHACACIVHLIIYT